MFVLRYVPTPENYIYQILLGAVAVLQLDWWRNLFSCKFRCRTKRWFDDRFQKKTNLPIALLEAS